MLKEIGLGRVIGLLNRQDVPGKHVSQFGIIEKPHQPGKYRLIVDLSHPEKSSVNDGIDAEICTLQYVSVDRAAAREVAQGGAARPTKFDFKSLPGSPNTPRAQTYARDGMERP